MNELNEIEKLKSEGYNKVWVYEAEPGEVDDEHSHGYDTKLVILKGGINITSEINGVIVNMQYNTGDEIFIPRNKPHSAKVEPEGCRYIVAEKY